MKSPVTPAAFATVLVGVGVGVGLVSAAAALLLVVEFVAVEFEVEFVVVLEALAAVAFALFVVDEDCVVDFFVVVADLVLVVALLFVAVVVEALALLDEDETDEADPVFACAPVVPTALPEGSASSVEFNCGGVIANTAPRPPTVPPAMRSVRFISVSFFTPRSFPTPAASNNFLKTL